MVNRAAVARATLAHLAYTSLFERVVPTSITLAHAPYGALVSVEGAAGSIAVGTPLVIQPSAYSGVKDTFHFAVVNSDGAHPITIASTDGQLINGAASILLPATAGASALLFYSNQLGEWVALLGGSGGQAAIQSFTNVTAGVTLSNAAQTGIVATPAINVTEVGQKIHIVAWAEVDNDGATQNGTFQLSLDGAASDTAIQTIVGGAAQIVHLSTLYTPAVGLHNAALSGQATNPASLVVTAPKARITAILLPG